MVGDGGEFIAVSTRRIPPDPGVLKAIGRGHDLNTAIADLIDNSIDAHASNILVRFVFHGGVIDRLLVVDDGDGMDEHGIDNAMQLGRPKVDSAGALGFFGVGLKAASFANAALLTVLSRTAVDVPHGRRLSRDGTQGGFECEVLDRAQVAAALDVSWPGFSTPHGTIVQWDSIESFPPSPDSAAAHEFADSAIRQLRLHLGLHLHRWLEKKTIRIGLDVFDGDAGEQVFPYELEPVDPFGYRRTGAPGYPKTLVAMVNDVGVPLICHVWPGRSDSPSFKLSGRPVESFQGFFVYRNQRLLSAGGWLGVTTENRRLRLARVMVDIEDHMDIFVMDSGKTKVRMSPELKHAVRFAVAPDGTTFENYLATAESAFRDSNKRIRTRTPALPPGRGFPPSVRATMAEQMPLLDEDGVNVRWTAFAGDDLVWVDRDARTLWLNKKYREALLNGAAGSFNDVPLLKSLLFLLYEDIFRGLGVGAKDKENMDIWQRILTSAAQTQQRDHDR